MTEGMEDRAWEVDNDERPLLPALRHRSPPRSLDALHRAPVTMIILDDSEDPFNPEKLLSDSRSVHRPATPTPSLPSYEFSQSQAQAVQCRPEELEAQSLEQEEEEEDKPQSERVKRGCWPQKAHRKFRRALVYALVVYFVITVAVGAPILVLVRGPSLICMSLVLIPLQRLRHHASEHSPFPPKSSSSGVSLISDSVQTLPKSLAVACNAWTDHTPTSATYVLLVYQFQHGTH